MKLCQPCQVCSTALLRLLHRRQGASIYLCLCHLQRDHTQAAANLTTTTNIRTRTQRSPTAAETEIGRVPTTGALILTKHRETPITTKRQIEGNTSDLTITVIKVTLNRIKIKKTMTITTITQVAVAVSGIGIVMGI